MTCVSRRAVAALVGAIALGSILSACSSNSADSDGTSGQSDAFVAVDVSSGPFVSIENRTDQALIDVNIDIKGGMILYTASVSRLEPKEKRQIRHAEFTSHDGTSFSLRIARPREVAVTARDVAGKQFDATVPWE